MKVLLLTSPAPARREYGFFLGEKRFPLGLGYMASMLRNNGISVDLVDLYAKNRVVAFENYDFIGVYCNTICFERGTLPLLNKIRNSSFKGKIVVGGPHAALLPHTIPDFVDHIVQGEGEYAMLSIVNGDKNDRIIKAPRIENLDDLPFPAYDLYNLKLYNLKFEEAKNVKRVFTYSSSRGCPFSCRFCSSKNIYNRKWTTHSAARIVSDIERLQKEYSVGGIYFREDNFTVNTKRINDFCDLILKKGVKVKWKCETRVDVDFETLKKMKEAGCTIVYVGFESGSPRVLELIDKKINLEKSVDFVNNCKKVGIKIYGSFIIGIPQETKEDIAMTNAFIDTLKLDRVCKNKYLAMPGSEMYDDIIANPSLAERYNTTVIRF